MECATDEYCSTKFVAGRDSNLKLFSLTVVVQLGDFLTEGSPLFFNLNEIGAHKAPHEE